MMMAGIIKGTLKVSASVDIKGYNQLPQKSFFIFGVTYGVKNLTPSSVSTLSKAANTKLEGIIQ